MLLLFTFEEPSRGSRTTEKRSRPTSFTSPISSEATWATRFDFLNSSTSRSFIHTSSSSCCSPYTFRVVAGSLRIGSSRRTREARPANRPSRTDRSPSNLAACSARVATVLVPSSVLSVPSFEMVLELLLAAVEVPPRSRILLREIRENPEVLHALRLHVRHLRGEVLLLEGVLPDRATCEEPGRTALDRVLDEYLEDVE